MASRAFSKMQTLLVSTAEAVLADEPWYTKVCVDDLESDKMTLSDFEGALASLIYKTNAVSNPNFLRPVADLVDGVVPSGLVLVDGGALQMALNVLFRAGKVEVAEELRKSAFRLGD